MPAEIVGYIKRAGSRVPRIPEGCTRISLAAFSLSSRANRGPRDRDWRQLLPKTPSAPHLSDAWFQVETSLHLGEISTEEARLRLFFINRPYYSSRRVAPSLTLNPGDASRRICSCSSQSSQNSREFSFSYEFLTFAIFLYIMNKWKPRRRWKIWRFCHVYNPFMQFKYCKNKSVG